MSDIVERLRSESTMSQRLILAPAIQREAADEIEKLRAALRLAMDAVEHWASYASSYAQEKHDLAGDLQKLRAALGEKK